MINGYGILSDANCNGLQNYSVFQPAINYFKPITNDTAKAWKSIGLSDENTKPPATSDNSLNARLNYFKIPKFWVDFTGSCLKTNRTNCWKTHLYITYEVKPWLYYSDYDLH